MLFLADTQRVKCHTSRPMHPLSRRPGDRKSPGKFGHVVPLPSCHRVPNFPSASGSRSLGLGLPCLQICPSLPLECSPDYLQRSPSPLSSSHLLDPCDSIFGPFCCHRPIFWTHDSTPQRISLSLFLQHGQQSDAKRAHPGALFAILPVDSAWTRTVFFALNRTGGASNQMI